MGVDSELKRKSVPRWITGIPGFGGHGVIPDGGLDAIDRQIANNVYGGIAAGLPGGGGVTGRKKQNGLLLGVY